MNEDIIFKNNFTIKWNLKWILRTQINFKTFNANGKYSNNF